jgi:translation initiation factor 1
MDLKDQLQNLFPDHQPSEPEKDESEDNSIGIWLQEDPLLCKYEKRKGKPNTIIDNYNGAKSDFKILTKHLKKLCSVGGSHDDKRIIIQGDFRDKIMQELKDLGFNVKRVGG